MHFPLLLERAPTIIGPGASIFNPVGSIRTGAHPAVLARMSPSVVDEPATNVNVVTAVVAVSVRQCPPVSAGDTSSTTYGDQAFYVVAGELTRV